MAIDANQDLVDLFRRLIVENYMIFATSILLFYDHAMTFTQEVKCVWRRRFSGATLLFLVTRYSATLERVVLLISLFIQTTSDQTCTRVLRLDDALIDLNTLSIGAFMAVRIYAIWGQDVRLFAFMMLFVIARVIIALYFQTHYTPLAFGLPLWGCGAQFQVSENLYNHLHVTSDAIGLASDILLLVLTWMKTLEISRTSSRINVHTPIATLLLRDGTVYFVIVFFLQVFSIVAQQVGVDFELFQVWSYWNQSITVIFLCRFMLNLRNVYTASGASTHTSTANTSTLFFRKPPSPATDTDTTARATPPDTAKGESWFARSTRGAGESRLIGNLGAPLAYGSSFGSASEEGAAVSPADGTPGGAEGVEEVAREGYDAEDVDRDVIVVHANPLGADLVERPVETREMVEMRTPV